MLADRRDKGVDHRFRVRGHDYTGIWLSIRHWRVDPERSKQFVALAQRQDRFAVPILVLDELEGSTVIAECIDGGTACWQHQRVIENGWRCFEADVDLNRVSCRRLHRPERRGDKPRHGSLI